MNELYVWRDKIGEIYREKTKLVEIALRFIVALMVFIYINKHIGFMGLLSKGIVTFGLSAVCAVLPLVLLMVIAVGVILLHTYSLSMVLAGCIAVIFLMMFIVYFRFTSDLVVVVLLTPITMAFNIPYVLAVACGLLVGPSAVIPMACGVVVYYVVKIIETMSTIEGTGVLSVDGAMADALGLASELMGCKEMICYIMVLCIGVWVVNGVKRIQMNYAWKIAIGSGILTMFITALIGSAVLDCKISFIGLFIGSILAAGVGLVVEFLFFKLDYQKTEYLEFDDDEFYYYVKAIPKAQEATPITPRSSTRRRSGGRTRMNEIEELKMQRIKALDTDEEIDEDVYDDEMYGEEVDTTNVHDATMVLQTEDIERELRLNAHAKAVESKTTQQRHVKTNYHMLKESIKNELNGK